ncbi:MAG: hypothetical protein JRH11_08685 [Deltaproteobacteria bacterium]|nr:hypothetical protein [Deltaproteobacteria bacterium]
MRPRVLGLHLLVLVFTSACGGSVAADSVHAGDPPASGDGREPYPSFAEAQAMARDCEAPDAAAIEIRSITIDARGTRSQTMTLAAEVLASRYGRVTGELRVAHYVGGDVFMEEGRRYLVVLCKPAQVIGWRHLEAGDPAADVASVELAGARDAAQGGAPSGAQDGAQDGVGRGAGDGIEEAQIPVRYFIEGDEVDESTFVALFDRLEVDEQPIESETVENPDGSYGGSGATYVAREGEVRYRYDSVSFRDEAGVVTESRSLSRD